MGMVKRCGCRAGMAWHDRGALGWCRYADFSGFLAGLRAKGVTDFPSQWTAMLNKYGRAGDWLWENVPRDFIAARLTRDWRSKVDGDRTLLYDAAAGLWRTPEEAVDTWLVRHRHRHILGDADTAGQMNREGL